METLKLGIDGLDDIEQIGAGGSSRVYRAKQVELDRLVALKVLKASDDPEVARRFDRERKAMGRLSLNEGIVPVYSSGITDRGEPYLIMPYYPNGSLQDRIEAGPVPWDEAAAYIASAAETMAAAHEADVVHLDLKPANILLSSNGAPRIADFGIAKLMSEQTASGNTGPAFTPTFTAPETLLGGDASPASDVYGLAATLWALIAGRPPFRAIDGEDNTLMAVVGRVVHQPAGDLRQLAPDPICSIIEIAMAKEPTDRYPTAGAFRQALAGAVAAVSTKGAGQPTVAAGPAVVAGAAGAPAGAAGAPAGAAGAPAGSAGGAAPGSAATQAQNAQSSLQFDAAVPPRLVPAGNARAAGLTDAVDRYSGVIVGLGVAAILLIAVFLGQRLLSANETAASDSSTQVIEANAQTSSTALGALAGAGGADDSSDDVLAGPTTTSTTERTTTTVEATVSVTTTPISATTELSTTTSTEETTSSSEETTTTEDTTSTTEPSTSSSETTDTTTSTSSSSSTETTASTVPIPRLGLPQGVTARLVDDRVIISWSPPDEAEGLAGFTVLRDGVALASTGPGGVRHIDRNVTPGEIYVYQVRSDGPPDGEPESSLPSARIEVAIPIDQDDPNANEPEAAGP